MDHLARSETADLHALVVLKAAEVGEFIVGHAGPSRWHEQDPMAFRRPRQRQYGVPAVLGREVEILDEPDERLLLSQSAHQVDAHRMERIPLQLLGVRRRALMLHQGCERGHERRSDRQVGRERAREVHLAEPVEDRIRDAAQSSRRRVGAVEDVDLPVLQAAQESVEQSRLADPRLALDEDRVALGVLGPLPRLVERLEVAVPPAQLSLPPHADLRQVRDSQTELRLTIPPPRGPLTVFQDSPDNLGRLEAVGGVLGEQRGDQLREESGRLAVPIRDTGRLELQVRLHHRRGVVA
jgi:hypothetical protein